MKNISKRVIAFIVAGILILTCVPVGVFTLAGGSDVPENHFFNFASQSLYVEDSSLSKGNYSKDFGLSNGKCNITQNGTAYRYTDGDLAGLRLLSSGSIIKAGRELSVTKNTSYTIVVRMRTASNGKAFYLNIKENKDSTDNVVSMVTDTSSSKKNYYVATFNSGDKTSIFLEFEAPANGSGVIYNLAIQAEKSDFADGGFESGSINGGWVQNYPKDPVLVSGSDAKTGNYAMQVSGYSEISAYVNVEPNNDYVITGNVKVTGTYTNFQIQPMTSGMAVSSSNAISANNKYTSSSEWQKVSVPFNSGNNSLVWLRLIVDGSATAVFDDISIKKKEKVVASTESEYYNLSFAGTAEDAAPNIALFATDSGAPNISGDGKVDYSTEGALWLDARQKTQDIVTAAVVNVKKNTQYDLVVRMRSMSDTLMPTVSIYDETMQNIFSSINAVDKNKKYYTAEFTTDDSGKVSIILKMPATAAGLIYSISLIPRQENIINGNFECGDLSGWTRETSATSNLIHKGVVSANSSKVRRGYCSLELAPSSTYSTYFYANAGVTYTVNMSVKAETDFKALLLGFNSETVGSATADKLYNQVISGDSKWQDIAFEYTAEESRLVWLCLEGTSTNTYIDNIYVNPKRTEITDGSFDTTLDIWRNVINNSNSEEGNYLTRPYTPVTITSDRSYNNAGNSMYLNGTSDICETEYMITLKPNTRYLLEYYAYVESNGVKAFVFDNAEKTTDSKAYINKSMYKKSDWVRNSYTFVTDTTATTYRIVFRADGGSAYIDDIVCIELPELNVTDSLTKETNHILNFSSKELYTQLLNDYVSNDFANAERTANVTNNGSVIYAEDGVLSGMQIKADDNALTQSEANFKVKPNTNYTLTVRMKSSKSKQLTVKARTVDGLSDYAELTTNVSDKKVFTSSFVTGSEEFVKILVDMQSGGTGLIYYISLIEDNDVLQNGTFESGNLNGWVQVYTKAATLETENTHSGEYAMKLSGYSEYITYLTLKENTEYEISAYVKTDTKAYIRLRSLVNGVTPSTANMPPIIQKTATSSKDYRKVVFRFNSESNTKVWLQLAVDKDETAYFDDISISVYNEPALMEETNHYFSFSENDLYVDTGIWNEKTSSNIFTNTDFALEDGSANISNSGVVSFYDEANGTAGMRLNATGGIDLKTAKKLRVKPNTKYTVVTRMRTMTDGSALTLKLRKSDGITDYVTLTSSTDKNKYWYSAEFTTGDEEYLLLYFEAPKNSSGLVYTLAIQENTAILENGNFETGDTTGWVCDYNSDGSIVNAKTENNSTNVKNGNAALKLVGYNAYSSYINVSPNTDYFWHGWVKTNGPAYVTALEFQSGKILSMGSAKNLVKQKISASDEWQEFTLTFNTGENSIVWLNVSVEEGSCAYFDDLRAQPLYDSIVDGDFEKSVDNWKNITESTADKKGVYKIETTPVALSNKAHNGNSSLFFDGTNNMSSADYVMQVEKNTRYYVFFWGLATDFDAEICIAGLNNEFLPLKKKNINSNGEWQKYILSVDSGDNTLMSLKFLQLSGGKLYVDQLEFATSIKGATLPTAVVTETQSRLWVLKENGNNLVPNAGFESSISGTMTNFVNGKYAKRVKGENSAANGEYGLQFKTLSNEENSTILWINVNKNTDYAFSVNVKAPYLSDTNKGNITFGIVDGLLGDYLVDTQGVTCSIVPSALDNEWHTLGYEFNSGNQSKIGIMITGANSEAWFDDLMLCLKTDAEKLQWGNNNGTLSLEDSYPKNIGCAPEDNLIGCYDFEGDLSFWEDGMGYEKVFNIVDSKIDEAGKVLSFDSKDKPTHNRYIKWIEVKPDTEYTLSVMLRCDEDSLSNFSVFEKVYGGYASLIDVEAGEAEKKWKNIAFTFKTGDNNEIGLSFYDGGGSVVYNDIRLFETSKGIYMDIPTYGLISADETPEKSETNILLIALISGVSLLVVCGVLLIVFILRRKRKATA